MGDASVAAIHPGARTRQLSATDVPGSPGAQGPAWEAGLACPATSRCRRAPPRCPSPVGPAAATHQYALPGVAGIAILALGIPGVRSSTPTLLFCYIATELHAIEECAFFGYHSFPGHLGCPATTAISTAISSCPQTPVIPHQYPPGSGNNSTKIAPFQFRFLKCQNHRKRTDSGLPLAPGTEPFFGREGQNGKAEGRSGTGREGEGGGKDLSGRPEKRPV